MERRLILTIISLIVLGIAIVILFLKTNIDMADFFTQLAVGLTLLLPIIGYWGFKPFIDRYLERRKESINENKQNQEKTITKPNTGIQYYNTRDDLPKFKELIDSATKTVDMSALSYYLMILGQSNVIKKALKKGRKFTFLILDVNSKEVDKYIQTLENAKDLKNHINSTLEILCELKKELKDKDNLTIKTYDSFPKHGITLIDKDTENALVKVEYYNFDNPKTRANKIAYKVDNPDFYESSLTDYNELLEKSKDYIC